MKKTKINIKDKTVTLLIEDLSGCCFELWDVDGKTTTSVKIEVPEEVWENLIKKYENKRGKK
tara:strand:+ start:849 stop:1034 length:186 start_codon:yes stop_codon:yes gene_type:complete